MLPPARLLGSVATNEKLEAPWPRLIISIGRRSVPIALAIKRLAAPNAFALHIQNPQVPARLFDLIAAPVHDGFEAPNVITTFGAVHSVTGDRLAEAGKRFAPRVEQLPHPRITVLLGGESQAFSFPPDHAAALGAKLAHMAKESGGALLVTPSRRTRADSVAALAHAIKDVPHLLWDGAGDNPYFAFLALRRCHRRHRRLGQHGHRGGGHRQAGLCAKAARPLDQARPLPPPDAGARRDSALRGPA